MRYLILPILSAFLMTVACQNKTQEQETASSQVNFCLNDQLKQTTNIIAVSQQQITEQLTLSGKIEYDENDLLVFRSLLEGVVEKVAFELGDYVSKGSVLATIKSTQIQELHQQRLFQQNQITLLDKQAETKKDLLADGMIAASELLEIQNKLESAKLELDRIKQSLQLYRATGSGTFEILAPRNGYIIQKSVSTGQIITTDSEPLFAISNLKQVWVMINIYASNLRHIHSGDPVKVRTIAYPDRFYTGNIDKIYNVFDDNEHVLKARVILNNENLNLMPGLNTDIIIDKKNTLGSAFAIPHKAVVFSNNKNYIVVYKDDCHLEIREITAIASNEEYTYIKEIIAENEHVIGSNALLIFQQLSQ